MTQSETRLIHKLPARSPQWVQRTKKRTNNTRPTDGPQVSAGRCFPSSCSASDAEAKFRRPTNMRPVERRLWPVMKRRLMETNENATSNSRKKRINLAREKNRSIARDYNRILSSYGKYIPVQKGIRSIEFI